MIFWIIQIFGYEKGLGEMISEVFALIPVALLIEWERPVTHARRGRDGREEGCESGYYDLHRDLNDTLFHASPPFG